MKNQLSTMMKQFKFLGERMEMTIIRIQQWPLEI